MKTVVKIQFLGNSTADLYEDYIGATIQGSFVVFEAQNGDMFVYHERKIDSFEVLQGV